MMDRDRGCLLTACRSFPNQLEQLQRGKKQVKNKQNRFVPITITAFASLCTQAWLPGVKEERLQISQRNINRSNR